MHLKEITEKFSTLNVYERRSDSNEYVELVFFNSETDEWKKIFTEILGPAIKPPGAQPTEGDLQLTKDYGSIFDDQTLFKKEFDSATVIAMFWPWQDDVHTTLKIALLKSEGEL